MKQNRHISGKIFLHGVLGLCVFLFFSFRTEAHRLNPEMLSLNSTAVSLGAPIQFNTPFQKGKIAPIYKRFKSKILPVKFESHCSDSFQLTTCFDSRLGLCYLKRFILPSYFTFKSSRAPPFLF